MPTVFSSTTKTRTNEINDKQVEVKDKGHELRLWLEKSPREEINDKANQSLGFRDYQETEGLSLNWTKVLNVPVSDITQAQVILNILGSACI